MRGRRALPPAQDRPCARRRAARAPEPTSDLDSAGAREGKTEAGTVPGARCARADPSWTASNTDSEVPWSFKPCLYALRPGGCPCLTPYSHLRTHTHTQVFTRTGKAGLACIGD